MRLPASYFFVFTKRTLPGISPNVGARDCFFFHEKGAFPRPKTNLPYTSLGPDRSQICRQGTPAAAAAAASASVVGLSPVATQCL